MAVILKAVAAVVRGNGAELLAFRHPLAGVQLPRGTVEPGETPAAAALRELHEESGLLLEAEPVAIGTWERVLDGRFGEKASFDVHVWHVHLLAAPAGLPERWDHRASGSAEEDGLVFAFHWLPVDATLGQRLHPVFGATVELLASVSRWRGPDRAGQLIE
jgi:8-oxo-dGTP pyrophosphatase MutT (NUDIX family)